MRRDRIVSSMRNFSFIIGIREDYKLENIVVTIGGMLAILLSIYNNVLGALVGYPLLLFPIITVYNAYRKGYRRNYFIPLYPVIVSAIASLFNMLLVPVAMANGLFIEDFTIYVSVDVASVKRTWRILINPISRGELVVLIIITVIASVISFQVTHMIYVFLYPIITYALLVYSLILVPYEFRVKEEKKSILEEMSRRIAILYYLFIKLYTTPKMIRLGKEAGLIGYNYFNTMKKIAGLFTLIMYILLSVSPILYIFIGSYSMIVILVIPALTLVSPYIYIIQKRSGRKGKISKNMLLILAYLASMKSVAESFTNMMIHLKKNKNLANLFSLDQEAEIYHQLFLSKGIEGVTMKEYADTIPDEFYRDTIRTMQDIEENEGVGATFRSLVTRLKDFTSRYIDSVTSIFENIGSNVISVVMLVETALPMMMIASSPTAIPWVMLGGGLLSTVLTFFISSIALPNLPSDYKLDKRRLRRGAVLFALASTGFVIIEKILTPDILGYEIIINIPVAFGVLVYYVYREDMAINSALLDKFSDLLVLFSSSLSRHNSTERAFLELSAQPTFNERLRNLFKRMAKMFTYLNADKLEYRGPYWYKFLLFLSSVATIYGVTPRELYKTVSTFMLDFKRFFNQVKGFGSSMLFLTLIGLAIMTLEVDIATRFLTAVSAIVSSPEVSSLHIDTGLPHLTQDQINHLAVLGKVILLVVAIMNGASLGKLISGTFRDTRYMIILFLVELVTIFVVSKTHIGFTIPTPAGGS